MSEENMTSRRSGFSTLNTLIVLVLVAWLGIVPVTVVAQAQAARQPTAPGMKAFASPQQAAEELIKAAAAFDVSELMAIFGPDAEDLVSSADPVRDKNNAIAFGNEARASHSVKIDPAKPNRATIVVGSKGWFLPVPLVKKNGKWYFAESEPMNWTLFRFVAAS
jgi:hypothetical protein